MGLRFLPVFIGYVIPTADKKQIHAATHQIRGIRTNT